MSDRIGDVPPPDEGPRSGIAARTLRFNERVKFTAAWLNGLATAVIAAGAFTPFFAAIYGVSAFHSGFASIALISAFCVCAGLALHLLGRSLLNGLRP